MSDISPEMKTITTILRHTGLVMAYLTRFSNVLEHRAAIHDLSKFSDDEFNGFVKINQIAREHKYGSPEYRKAIRETNVVPLHYSRHPHHPEHYQGGIDEMSLIDIIEMVADWKAASETYGQTSLKESLEIQKDRFRLRLEHLYLIELIIDELE